MKVFSVIDPVFKTEPLFIVGCSYDALRAYMRKRFRVTLDDDGDHCAGRMFTLARAPWRVVWTRQIDPPVALHEIFHLVTRICYDRGIPIVAHHPNGENGDETAAYLYEYFARRVLKRLR